MSQRPVPRIVDSLALEYGYQTTIRDPLTGEDNPNPETKQQFVKRKIKEFIIAGVKNQDLIAARNAADATISSINLA